MTLLRFHCPRAHANTWLLVSFGCAAHTIASLPWLSTTFLAGLSEQLLVQTSLAISR